MKKCAKKEKYLQQKNQNNGNKFGLTGPVSAVNSLPVIPRGHTNHFNHSILIQNSIVTISLFCAGIP